MASEKSAMALIRAYRPSFRNNADKVAFAVHSSFVAAGFVLTATGPRAFAEDAISSSSSTDEAGIEHWNEFDDEYAFVYVNPEKNNKKVLVKCLAMGDKLLVDALADGAPEPVHVDININDYVKEDAGGNFAAQYNNFDKLVNKLDYNILSKLNGPSANDVSRSQPSETNPSRSYDEDQALPIISPGIVYPPINPAGHSDLLPGPGAGMYPTRGDFGGSMLIGMDDPRWGGGVGGQPGFPGVPGMVPPGGVPGARFDPFGPPGVPGFEPPNRFTRFPRRPGGGTHPDLEQPGSGGFDYI